MSAAIDAAPGDSDEKFRDTGSRSRVRPRPSIHDGPPSVLYTVKQVELAVRHHLDEVLKPAGITALQLHSAHPSVS